LQIVDLRLQIADLLLAAYRLPFATLTISTVSTIFSNFNGFYDFNEFSNFLMLDLTI
jgi:hypothetical protein